MHSTNTSKYTGGTSYHPSSVNAPARGAASGLKTKNKYLQEFEKVKAGYAQRTQAKKLGTKFPGGASSLPARQGQGLGGGYGGRQGQRIPGRQLFFYPSISTDHFLFASHIIPHLPPLPQTFISSTA